VVLRVGSRDELGLVVMLLMLGWCGIRSGGGWKGEMYLCFCTFLVNSASDVFLQRHCVLHKDIVGVGFVGLCWSNTIAIVRGSGV